MLQIKLICQSANLPICQSANLPIGDWPRPERRLALTIRSPVASRVNRKSPQRAKATLNTRPRQLHVWPSVFGAREITDGEMRVLLRR